MKKLATLFVASAVVAFASTSCGTKSAQAESTSDLKTKIENCTNPDSLKVYVAEAQAYAQKLVKEGKVEEAKKYLEQIEPAVKSKIPALAGTFDAVNGALDKVEASASDKAEDAKDAASAAVDSVGSAASQAADAVSQKASEVKDAAAEKVQEAKEATADAAQKGADKVKELLK
ncbi:hypothetical protein IMSAGC008_00305 [Muribaculaceae bacterium]|jgi:uncharacterized protein YjbJ (UPF0337 family)|nr:hypothetical protein IMSAGC008_00305 [Muribaculaceae bacterium]